jgi:hypothetical protein
MVISKHSTVVGVFTDEAQAEQAINELLRVGFSSDGINVARGSAMTGGFMDRLKSLFGGQEKTGPTTARDFIGLGVPEQGADFYQKELAADLEQQTSTILRQFGAHDARTYEA